MIADGSITLQRNPSVMGWDDKMEWKSAEVVSYTDVALEDASGCTLSFRDGSGSGYQLVYDTTNGLLVRSVASGTPTTLATFTSTQATFAKKVVMEAGLDVEVSSNSVLEVTSSKVQCKQDLEMAGSTSIISASGSNLVLGAASGSDLNLSTASTGKIKLSSSTGLNLEAVGNTVAKGANVLAQISSAAGSAFRVETGPSAPLLEVGEDSVTQLYDPGASVRITLDPEQAADAAQIRVGDGAGSKRGLLSLEHNSSGSKAGVLSLKADDGQEVCLSVWKYVSGVETYFRLWLTKGSAPATAPTSEDEAHKILGYVE